MKRILLASCIISLTLFPSCKGEVNKKQQHVQTMKPVISAVSILPAIDLAVSVRESIAGI